MISWKETQLEQPEPRKPVLLSKSTVEDFAGISVGYLIKRDEDDAVGWFFTNDGRPSVLSVWPYWTYLKETEIEIPDKPDIELVSNVSLYLQLLKNFEKKIQCLAFAMMYSGMGTYSLDYYVCGVLNRGLSLIYGFDTLINSDNFLSAAHLVRPMLDNYLRLNAAWLVSDPYSFAQEVWSGKSVNKIKDREGNSMTDSYLRDKAAINHPWIKDVYNETSGFIHFSGKHIMNATILHESDKRQLETYIGKTDNGVTNSSKLEAITCMIEICNCIVLATFGWIDTKRLDMLPDDEEVY